MNKPRELYLAGSVLILAGILDTFYLAWLISTQTSFRWRGGSLLYCWFGYKLIRGSERVYRDLRKWPLFLIAFFAGAVLLFMITELQCFVVPNIIRAYPFSWGMVVVPAYLAVCVSLLLLLNSPGCRLYFGAAVDSHKRSHLYQRKSTIGKMAAGSAGLVVLLTGPYLLSNPYLQAASTLRRHLGSSNFEPRLILRDSGIHNWKFSSEWQVIPSDSQSIYSVISTDDGGYEVGNNS